MHKRFWMQRKTRWCSWMRMKQVPASAWAGQITCCLNWVIWSQSFLSSQTRWPSVSRKPKKLHGLCNLICDAPRWTPKNWMSWIPGFRCGCHLHDAISARHRSCLDFCSLGRANYADSTKQLIWQRWRPQRPTVQRLTTRQRASYPCREPRLHPNCLGSLQMPCKSWVWWEGSLMSPLKNLLNRRVMARTRLFFGLLAMPACRYDRLPKSLLAVSCLAFR